MRGGIHFHIVNTCITIISDAVVSDAVWRRGPCEPPAVDPHAQRLQYIVALEYYGASRSRVVGSGGADRRLRGR